MAEDYISSSGERRSGNGRPAMTSWRPGSVCQNALLRAHRHRLGGQERSTALNDLERLRDALRDFAAAREWDQFHSPKNLAMALSAEAGELLETFQWLTEAQSRNPSPEALAAAGEEIADVLLYLIRLCDQLGIDPIAAADQKLLANAAKYPVDKARGNSKKYTEL
jgi:NTP pyrophosphatase (non-canonical NTP hydrolase)